MAIRPKTNGKWQVDCQVKGSPRYRATFDTKAQAQEAERCYLGGLPLPNVTSRGIVTLRDLYDAACREDWTQELSKPRNNAEWGLNNYFGWDRDATTVTARTMSEYKHYCRTEHANSENTINKKVSAFNVMFAHGYKQGLIDTPLKTSFSSLRDHNRRRVLTQEEDDKLIAFANNALGAEWADYFIVLIETGMRTQEAGNMKWQDVDFTQPVAKVWEAKGDKRIVPLTDRAVDALKRRVGHDKDRVFPSFTQSTLNKYKWPTVRMYFADESKDFVPHCLRHTAATRMIRAGVPPYTVQRWMGHKSIHTTMGYVHFDVSQFDAALDIMNAQKLRDTRRDMSHDTASETS